MKAVKLIFRSNYVKDLWFLKLYYFYVDKNTLRTKANNVFYGKKKMAWRKYW